MNRFLKLNSTWLSLLGLSFIIILLVFVFRPKSPDYQINANESLKLMNDQLVQVSVKDIAGKQLIDIRLPELYSQGHPENAINIPVRQLLDKESVELFNKLSKNGIEAVLYGSNELQATAPLFLLQQLGFKNVKRLKGGLTSSNEFQETEPASTEISVIDTAVIHIKPGLIDKSVTTPESKKSEAVLPVRKEASAGGGC
ncbi:MAG: rhodanese-like domain-containing protein [Mariniphaga sp.]|nr:rhodanese-like domain-containing protein [Mariniphaga sp.]